MVKITTDGCNQFVTKENYNIYLEELSLLIH